MSRKLCECGCGRQIKPNCRFITGHNRKGCHNSIEHTLKVAEANKGAGRKRCEKRVVREKRICMCGCDGVFVCKVNSSKRYLYTHHTKFQKKTPVEIRSCTCGCGKIFECKVNDPKRYVIGHPNNGVHFTNIHRRRISLSNKLKWQNSDSKNKRIEAIMRASHVSPNKAELLLDALLQRLFPCQYKYVGAGEVIIGGRCPDFINVNGQKKIIEMFGDYWHSEAVIGIPTEQHEKEKVLHYASYGYHTLIIWERELGNLQLLREKLVEFSDSAVKSCQK